MTEQDLKLAAVRFILGDELTRELVDDQWNAVNDLGDPYDEKGRSGRFSLEAANLASRTLSHIMDALKEPGLDLCQRRQAAYNALSEAERKAWHEDGVAPFSYYAETCTPLKGPKLTELLSAPLEDKNPGAGQG